MNGIEKITNRITEDAQRESDEIIAEARRQAAEITQRFQSTAETERVSALDRGRKNADERMQRLAGVAQLESKKLILAAKQESIDLAFDRALAKLLELPEADYVALMARLSVASVRSGKEQLLFSQGDRTRYGKKVVTAANELLAKAGKTAALTLSEQSRAMKGGVILSDGDVEINCSFETLIRLQREAIAGEVAEVLFS